MNGLHEKSEQQEFMKKMLTYWKWRFPDISDEEIESAMNEFRSVVEDAGFEIVKRVKRHM